MLIKRMSILLKRISDLENENANLDCMLEMCNGRIEELEAENKRLREALNEIKKTVEDAQDTVYPFHLALDSKDGVFILETVENALKGVEE